MGVFYIVFSICLIMLALISRKNYSKYKGNVLRRVLCGMAETVYGFAKKHFEIAITRERLGKTRLLSKSKLEEELKLRYIRQISMCICIMCGAVAISFFSFYGESREDVQDSIAITRADYGKDASGHKLYLDYEGDKKEYIFEVQPLKYSKEQFEQKCNLVFDELYEEMLGDNKTPEKIGDNLSLPIHDKDKIFDIMWKSDKPSSISSSGVLRDEAKDGEKVILTACIEYYDYSLERQYEVVIERNKENVPNEIKSAINELEKIERNNPEEKEFEIPGTIGSVSVNTTDKKNSVTAYILFAGLIFCVLYVIKEKDDLKNAVKTRDNMLMNKYSHFVNHLWLFLGTGMTIKSSLNCYVDGKNKMDFLEKEISHCLSLINSGYDEAKAYQELGSRLGLKEYNRLFMHISQNLKMGTRNIRNILEEEQLNASIVRRELAKKKGEEASTKLLVPMILSLFITMIVIIAPVIIGF